jgi:hypothetical protein
MRRRDVATTALLTCVQMDSRRHKREKGEVRMGRRGGEEGEKVRQKRR